MQMPMFHFKLEAVLEQRRSAELLRQQQLADAQRLLMRLERQLNDATQAITDHCLPDAGMIDAQALIAHARFNESMQQKLGLLREQLHIARESFQAAQIALTDAAKQRKVLEKLRENQQ